MDKAEIEAMRAHLAACYPPVEAEQRAKRPSAFAGLLRGRRTQPSEPVTAASEPLDLTVLVPEPAADSSIPEAPLPPAPSPRDGFGRRRDSILSLFDLWEPQPTVLDAARRPRRQREIEPAGLETHVPFFPGDLDDRPRAVTPAPRKALSSPPPPSATASILKPPRFAPDEATTLLAGLTALLLLEQRRLDRRLAIIPCAANDAQPPIAFRAAIR